MRANGRVAVSFPTPQDVPPQVRGALDKFEGIAEQFRAVLDKAHQADEIRRVAREADRRAAADAIAEGKKPKLNVHSDKAEAEIAETEALLEALRLACDEAGNAVGAAVSEAKEAWLADAEADAADALTAYHDALAGMQEAITKLGEANGVVSWLNRWHGGTSLIDTQQDQDYRGPQQVTIRTGQFTKLDSPDDVMKLLPILATVGDHEIEIDRNGVRRVKPEPPRTHKTQESTTVVGKSAVSL